MKKIVRLTESDLIRIVKRVISEQPEKQDVEMGLKPFIGLPLGLLNNRKDSDVIRELKMIEENVLRVAVTNPPKGVGSKNPLNSGTKKYYFFVCKPNSKIVEVMDINRNKLKTVQVKENFNMNKYSNEPNYVKISYALCLPMVKPKPLK